MDYRTQFDDHQRFICESGREEYEVYTVDDNGLPVVSGVNNRYDEIQSHRESVELSVLLQRYAQGDETALNKVQGVYEDIVDSPKTLADIYEYVKDAENSFNDLPPDSEIFSIIPLLSSGGKPERLNFLRSLISLLLPKDLRKRQLIALIIAAVITMVIRLVEMEVL